MTAELADREGERAARRAALAIAPGVMFVGIAGGIAFPILPIVGMDAGLSLPFIGLILAANRIGRVFFSPAVGVLSDRWGGRRLLLVGLLTQIAVLAMYLTGVVVNRPGAWFLFGRLLHGPGSAGVFVAAQVLALHAGGKRHGGMTSGLVRAAMSAGMPVGLVLGGLLAARFGNRVTFEAAMLSMVVATIAAWTLVPDLRAAHPSRAGLRDTLRVMSDRRVLAVGALNFGVFFSAQGTVLTTLVLFIRARRLALAHLGDQTTGSLSMGALVLVGGAATLLAGRLGDKHRAHARLGIGGLLVLVGGLLAMAAAWSPAALFVAVSIVGVGTGIANPCVVALLGLFVPSEQRGSAVGAAQLLGDVGGALGPITGAALLAHSTAAPFVVSAVVVAAVFPAGFWLVRAERRAHPLRAS